MVDFSLYDFYTGTSVGSLIYIRDKPTNLKCARNDVISQVTALELGKENQILVGYENGIVQTFDTIENKFSKIPDLEGEGAVVGLGISNKKIIISKRDGIINLYRKKKNNYFDINLDQKGTLDASSLNKVNVLGTGGEFNDFKLWDLETFQCTFKAKSLGHDMLNLPIPTSIRGIAGVQDNEDLSVCCTKEGHVLLYDTRAQRRPVVKFFEKQASYTTITLANTERQCLVGTTRGYLQLLDMKMGKCLKTFKGFTGGITGIYCDTTQPFVTTTSLDRHLRIHNLETKELLHKIYLKQNLTKVIVKPVVKEEEKDEELSNIFEETIEDVEVKKKKRKFDENQEVKKSKKKKVKKIKSVVES